MLPRRARHGPGHPPRANRARRPRAGPADADAATTTGAAAAQIEVDTSEAPELADYGAKIQALAEHWYPIIARRLPSDGYTPPQHVVIFFKKDMKGVAYTG